jgi:hypothetical protein
MMGQHTSATLSWTEQDADMRFGAFYPTGQKVSKNRRSQFGPDASETGGKRDHS